jgi:hypothetical protein
MCDFMCANNVQIQRDIRIGYECSFIFGLNVYWLDSWNVDYSRSSLSVETDYLGKSR